MKKLVSLTLMLGFLAGCSLDNSFFAPETVENYTFSNNIIPGQNRQLYTLTVNGKTIYGLHAFHTPGSTTKIVYFHGNYKNLDHYYKWIEIYWEMGYDVFSIDYEGYGKSEGEPSEEALLRDADAAMTFVLQDLNWNQNEIIIYGYSIGSVAAVYTSANYACRLLFLEAPIGNADGVLEHSSPVAIPSEFLVVKNFDNIERIKSTKNKVVIIQGDRDETLPYEKNGQRVYENAPDPKKFVLLNNVGHGDFPGDLGRENYKNLLYELFSF